MQININVDGIKTKLKKAWDEQPALCLAAGATALSGVAKLINADANRRNSLAWKKEVKRRTKNDSTQYKKH